MPTYRGQTFTSKEEFGFRQDSGLVWSYRERGVPDVILARADLWKNIGWDVTTNRTGPYIELVATRTQFDSSFPFQVEWTVSTELIEKSIWSLESVVTEAATFPTAPLLQGGRAGYRKGIEDAVSDKTELGSEYTGYPVAQNVLAELRRGVEGYEHDYTILTKTVRFDFEFPPAPLALSSTRTVLTTAQLQAQENIPGGVMFALPADGATMEQAVWGWRIREQTASITNATTGEHLTSWVFANWSSFLYDTP